MKKFKLDWERIIERNILNKLEVIFSAMSWDIIEIIGEPKIEPKPKKSSKPPKKPLKTSTKEPLKPDNKEDKGKDSPSNKGEKV